MKRGREASVGRKYRAMMRLVGEEDYEGAFAHSPGPTENGRPCYKPRIVSGVNTETGRRVWVVF